MRYEVNLGDWSRRAIIWSVAIFLPFIILIVFVPMITRFTLTPDIITAIFVLSIVFALFFLGLGKKKIHTGIVPLYLGMIFMFIGFGAFYGAMEFDGVTYDLISGQFVSYHKNQSWVLADADVPIFSVLALGGSAMFIFGFQQLWQNLYWIGRI